ncbi:basigin-like [Eptesicus fuscus]|uniref:basigin-like n=1 Tax=Eptesicus fuscus TaxID=29078 RepID=UPI002403EFB4|nr:basigin-like [Eptesicus fuscus]
MAAALLVVLGFTLLGIESGSGAGSNISTSILDDGSKTRLTCTLNSSDTAILGHRWMKGDRVVQEDSQPDLTTEYEVDPEELPGQYFCTFLSEPAGRTASLTVNGPPKIEAVTKSELGIEGERVVLVCESRSFPPVTEWAWYKINDTGDQLLNNKSQNKFVVSSETRTELHIQELDLKADPGQYACYGTNSEGKERAIITLRLRSRLAALWPFLGVVTEVIVLVTIILACEKCRKPEEVLGEEDTGSAPPKTSGHRVNDKDKRNAN